MVKTVIDHSNPSVISIISAMFELIENRGLKPNEVVSLVEAIKEETYEELVEVYNNL